MQETKFEQDLKEFFPDIYNLHVLGRQDPKVWTVVYALLEMKRDTSYGEITVTYQAGKINQAYKRCSLVAESRKKLTAIEQE